MLIDGATSRVQERVVSVSKLSLVHRVIAIPGEKQEESNAGAGNQCEERQRRRRHS